MDGMFSGTIILLKQQIVQAIPQIGSFIDDVFCGWNKDRNQRSQWISDLSSLNNKCKIPFREREREREFYSSKEGSKNNIRTKFQNVMSRLF